uniref:Uncharacterized protein n=1 Tax=Klebsiella pneumoniae TaxID=573 RepID=A0A2P1BNL9_KLEPN|nr:hypothetical protein [Klebsiella pneumoniae]
MWAAVSHGQPSFTSAWREFAAVRSATAMRRRHEVPDRHPNHQGQADVHQVRRPPVAEQPDRGRKHDGRADHAEQTAQPLPMTEPTQRVRRKASAANSGSRRLMNSPRTGSRSPARWPRRSWRGLESRRRSYRGNDAAERAGFIGNACHQSHEAALAVVVGLLAHCLTLDG